jgi:hypothetical protein
MTNLPPPRDAQRRRSATPWIIGGLVALAVLCVIAGVGGLFWYGLGEFNTQAGNAIRADPAIVHALGPIKSIHFDFMATGEAPGDEDFAYRVEGDRASGLLVGRFVTIDAGSEELRSGTLTLDDGRRIAIGTSRLRSTQPEETDGSQVPDQ